MGIVYKPFIIELTVFNVEGMGEGQVADLVKAFCGEKRARLIDLIECADSFSKTSWAGSQSVGWEKASLRV